MAKSSGTNKQSKAKHKKSYSRVTEHQVSRTELIMLSNNDAPQVILHSRKRVPSLSVMINAFLIIICLAVTVTLIRPWNRFTAHQDTREVKINVPITYVREGNGIEFPVVARIDNSSGAIYLEERGDWIRVRLPDARTGWVSKQDVIQ